MAERKADKDLAARLRELYPELELVANTGSSPVYVVGGAVRDALLGRGRGDLDLVVVGDPEPLAAALGATPVAAHERFGTATFELAGHRVDVSRARTETYPHPGALPEVSSAERIEDDLVRRDFSVNAIAVAPDSGEVVDPHGGRADIGARAAAGPASRLLPRRPDPGDPRRPLRRPSRLRARAGERADAAGDRPGDDLRRPPRRRAGASRRRTERAAGACAAGRVGPDRAAPRRRRAGRGGRRAARRRALARGSAARGGGPGRGAGPGGERGGAGGDASRCGRRRATSWPSAPARSSSSSPAPSAPPGSTNTSREWRPVALEIDGRALLEAGVPEGPALGAALRAARAAALDGEAPTHAEQLAVALRSAGLLS